MEAEYVVNLYDKLEAAGIRIWIDGGWAVDALIGRITRTHSDLDLAVEHGNVEKFRKFANSLGYGELERDEDKKWDFVLADGKGNELDVHGFSFDENGKVIEEDDWAGYGKDSLSGHGRISGRDVRCVSREHLMKTHDGKRRELKEKDLDDMAELSELKHLSPENVEIKAK